MVIEYKVRKWGQLEWCVVMGFDAFRIAMGNEPKTFSKFEVLAWLNVMATI